MTSKVQQKLIIAGGVSTLILFAVGSTIYLPFYSDFGKDRREEYRRTGKVAPIPSASTAVSPSGGSMWKHMDKEIKEKTK